MNSRHWIFTCISVTLPEFNPVAMRYLTFKIIGLISKLKIVLGYVEMRFTKSIKDLPMYLVQDAQSVGLHIRVIPVEKVLSEINYGAYQEFGRRPKTSDTLMFSSQKDYVDYVLNNNVE